jgi:hypothetical protein
MKPELPSRSALPPQAVDALAVAITKAIGSESARVFREAFAAATDDPEDHAFIATIAWLCANERLPIRDRLEDVVKVVNMAELAA